MDIENDPRYDASILAEALVIKSNSARLAAAQAAAHNIVDESQRKAEIYKSLAGSVYNHPDSIRAREQRKSQTISKET